MLGRVFLCEYVKNIFHIFCPFLILFTYFRFFTHFPHILARFGAKIQNCTYLDIVPKYLVTLKLKVTLFFYSFHRFFLKKSYNSCKLTAFSTDTINKFLARRVKFSKIMICNYFYNREWENNNFVLLSQIKTPFYALLGLLWLIWNQIFCFFLTTYFAFFDHINMTYFGLKNHIKIRALVIKKMNWLVDFPHKNV